MNLTKGQKIISIILIVLIIILGCLICLNVAEIEEDAADFANEVDLVTEKKESLIEILEEYDVEYLRRDSNRIYVTFNFQLYNEDGSSNEIKLKNLLNDLMDYFNSTFYIIDEKNDIDIKVFYRELGDNEVFINNKADFFDVTDGKTYYDVNNVKNTPVTNVYVVEDALSYITMKSLRYSDLVKRIGEPTGIDEDGYLLFDDGNIRVSKYEDANMIRNIIYSEKYLNAFVSKIEEGYSLEKVIEAYGEPTFGSLNEGYVGYRSSEFYLFFYEDEISVYGYGYTSNIEFEKLFEEYKVDYDIERLSSKLRAMWGGYHKYEMDVENKKLYITYPSRGVEVDINFKDLSGITFYSNYYFSDSLLEKIKNGDYTLKVDEDFIHIVEQERVGK